MHLVVKWFFLSALLKPGEVLAGWPDSRGSALCPGSNRKISKVLAFRSFLELTSLKTQTTCPGVALHTQTCPQANPMD